MGAALCSTHLCYFLAEEILTDLEFVRCVNLSREALLRRAKSQAQVIS